MEKHEGYQNYLKQIRESGIKPFARNIATRNDNLYKLFFKLTNISTKKLHLIPNIYTAKNILDIGCGAGETLIFINRFMNKSSKLYGVDLEKNELLDNSINFIKCDIDEDNLDIEKEYFDVVLSNFVIEHLKNPQRLFLEAYRVLKNGGYFYCSTEYYTSIFCPDYYNFYSDPTHIRPWTKRALKSLAVMSGFEVHKVGIIRWWEFLPLLPIFPVLNMITKSNFSFIPYEIFGRTVYIIAKKP